MNLTEVLGQCLNDIFEAYDLFSESEDQQEGTDESSPPEAGGDSMTTDTLLHPHFIESEYHDQIWGLTYSGTGSEQHTHDSNIELRTFANSFFTGAEYDFSSN